MEGFNIMSEAARESIGYLGGVLLAIAMLPQIMRMWITKSATDVSLLWTVLFLGGITFMLAYLVLLGHLAGWLPTAFEVVLAIVTIVLKVLLDHTDWGTRQKQKLEQQQMQQMRQQSLQSYMQPAEALVEVKVLNANAEAAAAAAGITTMSMLSLTGVQLSQTKITNTVITSSDGRIPAAVPVCPCCGAMQVTALQTHSAADSRI